MMLYHDVVYPPHCHLALVPLCTPVSVGSPSACLPASRNAMLFASASARRGSVLVAEMAAAAEANLRKAKARAKGKGKREE